jgi:hypothetical protein
LGEDTEELTLSWDETVEPTLSYGKDRKKGISLSGEGTVKLILSWVKN